MSASDFVMLKGGLTVPAQALDVVLDLEARGVRLEADGDFILVRPKDKLTDADRAAVTRWRTHILALLTYEPPGVFH
jgi:hypothetical protein